MLSHILMKVGRKLLYEELQIKFEFRHRLTYFFMSYCPLFKIRFPDISRLCFHLPEWKLVASFHMKSYRSSLTFATIDLLFHELLPFVQNLFSGHFSAMFSHIWMKVGKLPYEELKIMFHWNNGCRSEFVGVGGGPVLLQQYFQYACSYCVVVVFIQ